MSLVEKERKKRER